MIDILILVVCGLGIASLGLVVYTRNHQSVTNRYFGLLTLAVLSWSIMNYLSDTVDSYSLLFTRLVFLAGVLAISSVLAFVSRFPVESVFRLSLADVFQIVFAAIVGVTTFTPWLIQSVGIDDHQIHTGNLYWLYLLFVGYSLILFMIAIYRQNKAVRSHLEKQQFQIVAMGLIAYATIAITLNIIVPTFRGDWSVSRYGPAFTFLLIGSVAYSIIRYKLFDIRLVVARTIAYIGALSAIVLIYGIVVVSVLSSIFNLQLSLPAQAFISLTTGFAAFAFGGLKKWFDNLSNRFFYRDAYDSQDLYNELNQMFISTLNLEKLLHGLSTILKNYIKTDLCAVELYENNDRLLRIIGIPQSKETLGKITEINKLANKHRDDVIVADILDDNYVELKQQMHQNDLAIMVRLKIAATKNTEGIGYILLGRKKSGNIYNAQDIKMLETIANELVLVVQNISRFDEIRLFSEKLEEKIDDATKKLRITNEKLKKMDENKDEFISMASHQLRTPLTSVKGYVSMVLEGDVGPINDQQRQLLDQSFQSSQRMANLISDLLNLSRINTGKFVIDASPVDLSSVIEAELNQLHEMAEGRGVKLEYSAPEKFPTLMLDDGKMHQVIMNLIDNALYYTPSGGRVVAQLIETPSTVEFTVVDNGIGVPREAQKYLFSKMYRADNARRARPDGTGLGLFLVKKVIVEQKGAIIFETEEGKGSTFGFRFNKNDHLVPAGEVPRTDTI